MNAAFFTVFIVGVLLVCNMNKIYGCVSRYIRGSDCEEDVKNAKHDSELYDKYMKEQSTFNKSKKLKQMKGNKND